MQENFVPFLQLPAPTPFRILLAGTSYCDGSYRINRPHSNCLCVEYIEKGEGTVYCNGKRHTARQGDMYILPPGSDHYYFSGTEHPWQKIWFNADGDIITGLLSVYNPRGIVVFSNVQTGGDFIRRIHAALTEKETAQEQHAAAACILLQLLQFLFERYDQTAQREEIVRLKSYIETHLSEKITVQTLATRVYLSPSQVNRIFKKETGQSPYDYILTRRLERAKLLLHSTPLHIREISEVLGFCDEHYFAVIFKSKVGKTPSEYRDGK